MPAPSIAQALRANLAPGIALWLLALTVVLSYYVAPGIRPFFDAVGALKLEWGYAFSALGAVLSAGVIPALIARWRDRRWPAPPLRLWILLMLFWSYRGIEVDFLYRALDGWLGPSQTWQAVLAKVCCDQFGYALFWAIPGNVLVYRWRDGGLTWAALQAACNPSALKQILPVNTLANWMVWIPATACIYSLPLALQIPLCNIVGCFYVLLLQMLSRR